MRLDTSELPIIRAWYEFLIWILPKIHKFPRDQRFMLGNRIEDRILEIMELLIRARYSRDRLELLTQANTDLDVLLYLLRAAHDLKALPPKAYGDASGKLLEIGTQLGFRLSSTAQTSNRSPEFRGSRTTGARSVQSKVAAPVLC